ncbi:MAG: hypothetical protein R3B91_24045, partial [Planctomycetaceae bacterium]
MEHAECYYRKPDGTPTGETQNFRDALSPLSQLYRALVAAEFGPLKLKQVLERMIAEGIVRSSVNKRIARVKQVFKWGVENEHVPPHLQTCLSTVRGLKAGRSKSLESNPVTPVPQRDLEETIKHLTTTLADLFRVQLLTGMRPSEERLMLIGDLDTSRDVWLYCPDQHKTRDHGKRRMIWIGPQAQAIIQKHLSNDRRRYVFPSCRRRQNQPYTLNGYLSS